MSYHLIVRPSAEADVSDAFARYEGQRPGLGEEFIAALDEVMARIVGNPKTYQIIYDDARRALLHRFPYAVFYVAGSELVSVLAVLHQAADPSHWP